MLNVSKNLTPPVANMKKNTYGVVISWKDVTWYEHCDFPDIDMITKVIDDIETEEEPPELDLELG